MESIAFIAAYGDELKQVELSYNRGGYYHIYIDLFYCGQIINRSGKWFVLSQKKEYFTTDDMDALIEVIENGVFR